MAEPHDTIRRANETMPESVEGGLVESVKTAVIFALRDAFTGSSFGGGGKTPAHIDMEYPMDPAEYPGIWVQFSLSTLKRAGIAHEDAYRDEETGQAEFIQEWRFEGRIQLTVVAQTSLERDVILDKLIAMLAFSRPPRTWMADPEENTDQYRDFLTHISNNPFVSMGFNGDVILPGGESTAQVGSLESDPTALLYENTISFEMTGEFNVVFRRDGTYLLKRIDVIPETYDLTDWH